MKFISLIKRTLCVVCAAALVFALGGCGKDKSKKTVSAVTSGANYPTGIADPGRLTSEGYELPYKYDDGYVGVMKVVDDSAYETVSETPGGNIVFHLTTTKSEDEVKAFYDQYFSTLQKVKPKNENDTSVGYFDKEKRMILFNLNVWTANGKTNYKLGAEACDKLEDSKIWQAAN